jgi:hypothetical protein
MINSTYVGEVALRVLGGVVSGGALSLRFSLPFLLVCCFSYHLLVLQFFPSSR